MTVSLLTGTGQFNISDLVSTLSWLDLQGVQAKLRRVHRQFDGLITKLLVEHPAMAEEHAWEEGRLDFVDRLRLVAWSRPGRGGCVRGRPNRVGEEATGRIRSGPTVGAGWPDQTHDRGASMASLGSLSIKGTALALVSHNGRAHSRRVKCTIGATHVEEEEEQQWVIL
ncbi:hypothetical protein VPH35_021785 [Triticum aestivum]